MPVLDAYPVRSTAAGALLWGVEYMCDMAPALRPRPAQDVRGQSSCSMNTSYSTSLGYLTLLQAKHHTPNETSMFRVQSSEFISSFGVFAVPEERKGRDGGGGGGDRSGGQDAARRSGRGAAALACQRSHSLHGNVLV